MFLIVVLLHCNCRLFLSSGFRLTGEWLPYQLNQEYLNSTDAGLKLNHNALNNNLLFGLYRLKEIAITCIVLQIFA